MRNFSLYSNRLFNFDKLFWLHIQMKEEKAHTTQKSILVKVLKPILNQRRTKRKLKLPISPRKMWMMDQWINKGDKWLITQEITRVAWSRLCEWRFSVYDFFILISKFISIRLNSVILKYQKRISIEWSSLQQVHVVLYN